MAKTLRQVRLIGESTTQRDIAQRYLRVAHPSRCQFHPALYHKRVRCFTECAFEEPGEMRFATAHESTEIGYQHSIRDMRIQVGKHFAHLPGQQLAAPVPAYFPGVERDLFPQQCCCLGQCAVG
jgi:hypothetical protein